LDLTDLWAKNKAESFLAGFSRLVRSLLSEEAETLSEGLGDSRRGTGAGVRAGVVFYDSETRAWDAASVTGAGETETIVGLRLAGYSIARSSPCGAAEAYGPVLRLDKVPPATGRGLYCAIVSLRGAFTHNSAPVLVFVTPAESEGRAVQDELRILDDRYKDNTPPLPNWREVFLSLRAAAEP
jgi:hypothetical protein